MGERSLNKNGPHPAIEYLFKSEAVEPFQNIGRSGKHQDQNATSLSLARALAVGCISRLKPSQTSVNIWDPTAGAGLAGSLILGALRSAGVKTRYRGQDINRATAAICQDRVGGTPDSQVAAADTLMKDEFQDFSADLAIVDGPWGVGWASASDAIASRRAAGSFQFGLPNRSDSTWLFISLALEKLRAPEDGGGRVAALVTPGSLMQGGATAAVRKRIVEAGLLESVTRLPEGLAPNTAIPLYLLTFSNRNGESRSGNVTVADFQTQFTTERHRRKMPDAAIREMESGLRTGKPGPRNRTVPVHKFIRRDVNLTRRTQDGRTLSWRATTFGGTAIGTNFLDSRYGPDSDISILKEPTETIDLNPGPVLQDSARAVSKDIEAKGWKAVRLSALLITEPVTVSNAHLSQGEGQIFVPTTRDGKASVGDPDPESSGRILGFDIDCDRLEPRFLAAWLNSDRGILSRRRAIDMSSSGQYYKALSSNAGSLLRWADELIVPLPDGETQRQLAEADERLASFQDELSNQRELIWTSPERAEETIGKFAKVFDDELSGWFNDLPYPVASALWTAETKHSLGDKLEAYMHAWEAFAVFHATVLLAACRSDPGSSAMIENAIRATHIEYRIGLERASLGTWIVIIEKASKSLRDSFLGEDQDEKARVRSAFCGLHDTSIERLLAKEVLARLKTVVGKRNTWKAHGGHVSDAERQGRIDSLVSDLRELRSVLGNTWSQLPLVRAGRNRQLRDGCMQEVEIAMGTHSPFVTRELQVGQAMIDGDLYLARDGAAAPLPLGSLVQLRSAPSEAQYTSYYYNRMEGAVIRMVSYQFATESEIRVDAAQLRDELGALLS